MKKRKRQKKILGHEGRIRELSDSMKWNSICIIGVPEEEERKGTKMHMKKS